MRKLLAVLLSVLFMISVFPLNSFVGAVGTKNERYRESNENTEIRSTLSLVNAASTVCELNGHKYDHKCDATCNVCGDIRTTEGHLYDDEYDANCNECGDMRDIISDEYSSIYYSDEGPYDYTVSRGEVVVSFRGDTNIKGDIVVPDEIDGYPVTTIDYYCFANMKNVTSISIGKNIKKICPNAFNNCTGLTKVNITDLSAWCNIQFQSYPLSYAKNLYLNGNLVTDLVIPDNVTKISAAAFKDCTSLKTLTLGKNVKEVSTAAFSGCKGLNSVSLNEGLSKLYDTVFLGCSAVEDIVIPDSVGELGERVFESCTSLKSAKLSSSMSILPSYTFYGCGNIENVVIPDSIKTIDAYAFFDCSNLKNIILPNNLTAIETSAFENCYALEDLLLPNTLTTIGDKAFKYCLAMENVAIPDRVVSIKGNMFAYSGVKNISFGISVAQIMENAFESCHYLKTIVIPDSITFIGAGAFKNCARLESVTLPKKLRVLEEKIFSGCISLSDITLPNGLIKICNYAFQWCEKLDSFVIPEDIQVVGDLGITYSGKPEYRSGYYTFELNNENEAVIIDFSAGTVRDIKVPSDFFDYPVTGIDNFAFENCNEITSITVPESVKTIGVGAFNDCTSLNSITLPFIGSSRTAEDGYDAVLGYIFGYSEYSDSVTTRQYFKEGQSYYYYIPASLKSVTVTDAEQIPYGAFYNCKNLTNITIADTVTQIGRYAFYNTYFYNNSANWQNDVLYYNSFLIEAKASVSGKYVLKEETTVIADYAFYNNNKITAIELSDVLITIGKYAFYNCYFLADIALPNTLSTIGDYAFVGCSFTNLIIPNSVTKIGVSAFRGCSKLVEITLSDNITKLEYGTFEGCTKLTEIVIPNSVTEIGTDAFWYCTSLKNVTLSENLISIGENAFYSCEKLEDIIIPNGVIKIYICAFRECSALKTITLPKSIKDIGSMAFEGCLSLTDVYYNGCEANKVNISMPNNTQLLNVEWHYSYVYGDIDDNASVDLTDIVALAQYVAGWEDVYVNEFVSDVNGDGIVDLQDVIHLAQYVAKWDVKII